MRTIGIFDDNNICNGLKLAGMECFYVDTEEELGSALQAIPPEAGLILITSTLAEKYADVLEGYQGDRIESLPEFIEVPVEKGELDIK